MRLSKARVNQYRSIHDTGWFDVENAKTILVGPNEAGKTALLEALQQIKAPKGIAGFNPLRDYPRADYNDITIGKVDPSKHTVVEVRFMLETEDIDAIPDEFDGCTYVVGRQLDNSWWHRLDEAPCTKFGEIKNDLIRLCAHVDSRVPAAEEGAPEPEKPSVKVNAITKSWNDVERLTDQQAGALRSAMENILPSIEEGNAKEEKRYDGILKGLEIAEKREETLEILRERIPVFVLFNNYFRVRPLIHLAHLAKRIASGVLDDKQYDYGNQCLLKLLGFTAQELSDLGKTTEPAENDPNALQHYRDQLDERSYQLNAGSVRLTDEINKVWLPDPDRAEADRLRVTVDGQYLKVVVEDELGVEIELDQRSEGFQWLVSFFVVFFAEAAGKHANAILLLDEPGLSLHGLKQREFRSTLSRLAESNQTIYTTHSPFLVGPDELDKVRVIEMPDRRAGTKVHTTITAGDTAALLPLQEALGYDLANSLFAQQRNLVLEGLTDYWYLDSTAQLLRDANIAKLNDKIALIFANCAGKVVYYATILHAHNLKVAALLDSDSAGDNAAQQDTLVHTLGNKRILRTKDAYAGDVAKPEVEDLLRDTLVRVAADDLGWDVSATASKHPTQAIVDIFHREVAGFSKYKLAKAYIRWSRNNDATALSATEQEQWGTLIELINKALK